MENKIGAFDYLKGKKEQFEKESVLKWLSVAHDKELEFLHQRVESLAGHELTILNWARDKWFRARDEYRGFSYDKALERQSLPWTQEDLMSLGAEGNSYVEEAKKAKEIYLKKLREHLFLFGDLD